MTSKQKARKFAEKFCSTAGESYEDVMDGYDSETGGDDLMGVVINASDVASLESDVESLLDEYQMFYKSIKTICEFLALLFIFAAAMILPELF
mgnify:CR=1 FL=1|tara:strand:+ start:743 stop:1021 length:279 start_codon:yes stop_codon:yes gene_type:complete